MAQHYGLFPREVAILVVRPQALGISMIHVSFRDALPPWLSERARKAFQLANQEAHRLHHPEVGTEHLLLGLAKEAISPSAWALRFTGFDLTWLRSQVERCQPRSASEDVLPGPLPYAADLVAYIDRIEAGSSGGSVSVTPEQLLVGLIREPGNRIGGMLRRRWISWWLLRWLMRKVAGPGAANVDR